MQLTSELNSCGYKCRKSCFTQVGCTKRAVKPAESSLVSTTGFSFFSLICCFRIIAQCFVRTDLVKSPLKARRALNDVIQIFDVNVKWIAHTHTHSCTWYPPGCSRQRRGLVFHNVPRYHFYCREFNTFDILKLVVCRKRSCHVFHNFFFKISAFL